MRPPARRAAAPEGTLPETAAPETATPETATPEAAVTEAAVPEAAARPSRPVRAGAAVAAAVCALAALAALLVVRYPPWRGEWRPDAVQAYFARTAPCADGRVELNAADRAALCALPGIGPARAQAILDYRAQHGPFTDLAQLLQVHGIGPATLAGLQGLAYVEAP